MKNKKQNLENKKEKKRTSYSEYAGFWVRLAGFFLSILFVIIILFLISILWGVSAYMGYQFNGNISYLLFFSIIAFMLFNIYLYFKNGYNLSYKILGLKIIDKQNSQKPDNFILFVRGMVKYILFSIPMLNLFVFFYSVVEIFITPKKEALHDKLSGTLVVRTNSKRNWLIWLINILFISSFLWWSWFNIYQISL